MAVDRNFHCGNEGDKSFHNFLVQLRVYTSRNVRKSRLHKQQRRTTAAYPHKLQLEKEVLHIKDSSTMWHPKQLHKSLQ